MAWFKRKQKISEAPLDVRPIRELIGKRILTDLGPYAPRADIEILGLSTTGKHAQIRIYEGNGSRIEWVKSQAFVNVIDFLS